MSPVVTGSHEQKLLEVPARFRGLSVEPLWGKVDLPLDGIDLCIVGGQSGAGSKPFDLAWAADLQHQCQDVGTAFFIKQLGANAWLNGNRLTLQHGHGGDWNEWPPEFRVREMPVGFYEYRTSLMFKADESVVACSE